MEGHSQLGNGWFTLFSVTYQENKNQNGVNNTTFTPNWMVKLGLSYAPSKKRWSVGLFNSYYSKPDKQTCDVFSGVVDLNPLVDSYHQLEMNIAFHLPTLLKKSNMADVTFSLYGANLLNEDINFPDFNGKATNSVPQQSNCRV